MIPRAAEPEEPLRPAPVRRVRPGVRRVRRTVRRIDPLSVLKVSMFCYTFGLVAWLMFVAIVYWVLSTAGAFDLVERLDEIFVLSGGEFRISLGFVEKWAFIVGVLFVVVGSVTNMLIAFLYNIASDVVGGIQLTFVERDF